MSKNYLIDVEANEKNLQLRCAEFLDIEYLRVLKNTHSQYFFHKQFITQEQQEAWFLAYQARQNDFMFIVLFGDSRIGCMGIRLLDNKWDVYNVILGDNDYKGSGMMGRSFKAMLNFARGVKKRPIRLSVLRNNPAVSWYKKHGFKIDSEFPDHLVMSLINN